MKSARLLVTFLLLAAAGARGDVMYFGLQNIAIPTDQNGVHVNLEMGVTSASGNWHINPFFGGAGVANSALFQPARIGTGNEDRIVNVGFGGSVGSARNFSSGFAGSANSHLGPGADQFDPGQQGFLGFKYTPAGSDMYGWMRAVFTAGVPGGMLMDWAYDTSGAAIAAGNIQQAIPDGNSRSIVTLTAASGESPVLGTNLSNGTYAGNGYTTDVVKNGAGNWSLGQQSYTGTTIVNAGTLTVGANGGKLAGTSGIIVNQTGTLLFDNTATQPFSPAAPDVVGGDRINNAAAITINGGGTLKTNGQSEGTAPSSAGAADGMAGLGALTLANTSSSLRATIDFLSGANGSGLVFSSLSTASAGAFVNILNWTGMAGLDNGSAGNDRLLFQSVGTLTSANLTNFNFYNDGGALVGAGGMFIAYGNMFELVATPVPEPGTWAAAVLAMGAIAASLRNRLKARRKDSR